MTPAQRAIADKPSEATIARVTAAYLPQDAKVLHDFKVRTGWRIRVYVSPWTDGAVLACAERPGSGLHSEFPDLAAVKEWIRKLPV